MKKIFLRALLLFLLLPSLVFAGDVEFNAYNVIGSQVMNFTLQYGNDTKVLFEGSSLTNYYSNNDDFFGLRLVPNKDLIINAYASDGLGNCNKLSVWNLNLSLWEAYELSNTSFNDTYRYYWDNLSIELEEGYSYNVGVHDTGGNCNIRRYNTTPLPSNMNNFFDYYSSVLMQMSGSSVLANGSLLDKTYGFRYINVSEPISNFPTTNGSVSLTLPDTSNSTVFLINASPYLDAFATVETTTGTEYYNFTGLYQTVVTVNTKNAYTGNLINNFTGYAYDTTNEYNYTFSTEYNTTSFNALLGEHLIYVDVYEYSISSENTKTETFDDVTETINFSLYSENSIFINIYDEDTGSQITENITIDVLGNASEETYYTNTSTYFLENLTDGNYTIKFSGDNYTQRFYEVTVADRSSQTLNAYLITGSDVVTFSLIDYDTTQSIENVNILQQRFINNSWVTVTSKSSDITGRAQFGYTIGARYRFTLTHEDYTSKVFELDPIIYTSYVISLEKNLAVEEEYGLFDVTITRYPNVFENDANNSFTITFGSVGGSLENYGYLLTYPGGSHGDNGALANGETFLNGSFLITGAGYGDFANLTYWYKSTIGVNKTYQEQFFIQGATNNNTVYANANEDYGLGTLEKIIIAVSVTLVFAGVVTLFGNAVSGLIAGIIALGIFVYIGFLTVWIVVPTILIGLLMIMRRTSV